MFLSNHPNQAWDGTFNGKTCPMDVYYYLIKGKDSNQKEILLKGDITLIR